MRTPTPSESTCIFEMRPAYVDTLGPRKRTVMTCFNKCRLLVVFFLAVTAAISPLEYVGAFTHSSLAHRQHHTCRNHAVVEAPWDATPLLKPKTQETSLAFARLNPVSVSNTKKRYQRLAPLRYREHDENDSDTTLLKLGTRAPPLYDVKEAISQPPPSNSGVNTLLVRALLQNQFLVLTAATVISAAILVSSDGFGILTQLGDLLHWGGGGTAALDFTVTPARLAMGVIGALPVIALGSFIENSDKRAFANTNFSTIIMVMTLFGRRTAPPEEFIPEKLRGRSLPTSSASEVLLQSLALAVVTGFCEELVFRCEIPALITHFAGPNPLLALVGQAALFGLGHVSPGTSAAENGIVVGLQATNGLWFGLLYLLSGGDVVPCMIAHAVYDFQVFFLTWLSSNKQIEYAESMALEPFPSDTQREVQRIKAELDPRVDNQIFNFCKRLFYTFDFDKNETLSLSEVRKGISYLWLEKGDATPPPQSYVDGLFAACIDKRDNKTGIDLRSRLESNRLRFPDFLRLFLTLQQAAQPAAANK